MSNNKNIFEFLSDNESGDDNKKTNQPRVRTNKNKQAAKPATQQQEQDLPDRNRKQIDNKHKKQYNKDGQAPRRNRSKDRHVSGTGRGTQQRNYRKDGAGRGNVGTVKDELNREVREEEQPEEEEVESEEDNNVTLQQYLSQKGADLTELVHKEKEQAVLNKFDNSVLKKENLSVVQQKAAVEKKKISQSNSSNYKPVLGGDLADLVGFKTGFVAEKKERKRVPRTTEGEQKPAAVEGEQKEETSEKPREERRRNDKPRNDRNDRNKRDNKGAQNKPQQKPKSKGFNIENDTDFPTL